MRKLAIFLIFCSCCGINSVGQAGATAPPAMPQTARQALMEMFFSKTPGTFAKHLPAATLAALARSGAAASLQQYSVMVSQIQTQSPNMQTFETGSILLTTEEAKTGQKTEITVENDTLRGDQDDIELSFQVYKNGQPQRTPFMPQITFSMKQEAQVWTLNEISVAIHLPLADPDLLKALTDKMTMKPQSPTSVTFTPHAQNAAPLGSGDAMVVPAMRTILVAETTYSSRYKAVGYTCSLSSLDGFGGGEPNERQAMLINSGLASGKRFGFVFTLSECAGTPATTFRLTAAPNGNTFGRKAYCADQSGVIRSADDGNPATCLAGGAPVQ